jgi:preprotein translocase subunit SecA
MAGRGTDIKLTAESKAAGGLAIIGTERHESRRVDRQLRGRSGRQGDVGSSQFFVSLEDNLMRLFGSDRIASIMDRLGLDEGEVIQHSMISKSIERAQKKVEENNFATRKRLLEYDDVMNSQREVIYKRRRNALFGERLDLDILNMFYDTSEDIAIRAKDSQDYDSLKLNELSVFGVDLPITQESFTTIDPQELTHMLFEASLKHYKAKNDDVRLKTLPILKNIDATRGATVKEVLVPFSDGKKQVGVATPLQKSVETEGQTLVKSMEKMLTLAIIDQTWKEHLRDMDDLKQSVQTASYEQKDPLLIYKFEGYNLFKGFVSKVNEETVAFLSKAVVPIETPDQVAEARSRQAKQDYKTNKDESQSALQNRGPGNRPPVEKPAPAKSEKLYDRNDRVNVRYPDGTVKESVKYKLIEEDVKNNKCFIVD